ncbi:MAG TPA: hypothetical protein QF762_04975 [Acidimicrobiales bacterium]|nr:hypothetical protein [Acidimicrobiales bacterium]|tara:strand:- start:327 stop:905 length:579 start_codon:yes stop_codon:yes gene_type:complete
MLTALTVVGLKEHLSYVVRVAIHLLASPLVVTNPDLDIQLHPVSGDPRPLKEFLTNFPLAVVALDPYTHESSWILNTARRVLSNFRGADVRVAYLVTGTDSAGAQRFLGSLAEEIFALADPDRSLVRSLGVSNVPAFIVLKQDGTVLDAAEDWDPESWRGVAEKLSDLTSWSRPEFPAEGDPAPYAGTPSLG